LTFSPPLRPKPMSELRRRRDSILEPTQSHILILVQITYPQKRKYREVFYVDSTHQLCSRADIKTYQYRGCCWTLTLRPTHHLLGARTKYLVLTPSSCQYAFSRSLSSSFTTTSVGIWASLLKYLQTSLFLSFEITQNFLMIGIIEWPEESQFKQGPIGKGSGTRKSTRND
jgi:hypothetical protein